MFKRFLAFALAIAMTVAFWIIPASAATLTKVFSADYRNGSICADRTGNLDLQNQQAGIIGSISYAREGSTYYATSGSMNNGLYRYMYQNGNYQSLNSVYTMEAYVCLSDVVQSNTIEFFMGGDSPFVQLFWSDGYFGFGDTDNSIAVMDSQETILQNFGWYHIVVTNDGSVCTLYVNGQAVGTSSSIRVDGLWYFYLAHTAIDGYGVALYNIYNTAATASQVASLYTSCGGVLPSPTKEPTPRPTATVAPGVVEDAFKTVSQDIPVFKAGDLVTVKFDVTDIKAEGGLFGLDLILEYNTALLSPGDTLLMSSSSSEINTIAGGSNCQWWAVGRISGKNSADPQIILTMLEDNGNYAVLEDGRIWVSVTFTALADSVDGDFLVSVVRAYGTDSSLTKVDGIGTTVYAFEPVQEKVVTDIGLYTKPKKLLYAYGDPLDTTGLSILVKYSDGTTEYTSEGLEVSGYDPTAPGNQRLTVVYKGYTTSFTVTVAKRQGDLILVSKPSKMFYEINEELDLTGMSVATKIDGVKTPIAVEDCEITGFDSSVAGEVKISVQYQTQDTVYSNLFTVRILGSKFVVTAIGLGTKPKQLTYACSEALNTTGLSILVKYANGSTAYISEGLEVSGYDPMVIGDQRLTVTYQGYTTSFSVKVLDGLKREDLILVSKPSKLYYEIGEALDLAGMSVAVQIDGVMTPIAVEDCEITGFDSSTAGEVKISVQYKVQYTTYSNLFTISIIENKTAVTAIGLLSKPVKTYYKVGEALDITGLSLLVKYANGSTAYISEGLEVSGYDPMITGNQRLVVSYKGYTTSFSVNVA